MCEVAFLPLQEVGPWWEGLFVYLECGLKTPLNSRMFVDFSIVTESSR